MPLPASPAACFFRICNHVKSPANPPLATHIPHHEDSPKRNRPGGSFDGTTGAASPRFFEHQSAQKAAMRPTAAMAPTATATPVAASEESWWWYS